MQCLFIYLLVCLSFQSVIKNSPLLGWYQGPPYQNNTMVKKELELKHHVET